MSAPAAVRFDDGKHNAWLWPWTRRELVQNDRVFVSLAQYVAIRMCVRNGDLDRADALWRRAAEPSVSGVAAASYDVLQDAIFLLLARNPGKALLLRETRAIPIESEKVPNVAAAWMRVRDELFTTKQS